TDHRPGLETEVDESAQGRCCDWVANANLGAGIARHSRRILPPVRRTKPNCEGERQVAACPKEGHAHQAARPMTAGALRAQQRVYFAPEPQGHGALRGARCACALVSGWAGMTASLHFWSWL